MMNLLFVCTMGEHRSPTAARLLEAEETTTRYRGISPHSPVPLLPSDVEWAHEVFCFEPSQQDELRAVYGAVLDGKPLVCLFIPDEEERDSPALVRRIEQFFRERRWAGELGE